MKHTLLALLLLVITLLCPTLSKANTIGITTIKVKLNGNYTVEQKEEILEIRFKNFSKKDVNIQIENDLIIVKMYIEADRRYCVDLMTKKGELLILKPYSGGEIYPYLVQIDSLLSTPGFKAVKDEMYNASANKKDTDYDIAYMPDIEEETEQAYEIVEYEGEEHYVNFTPVIEISEEEDDVYDNEVSMFSTQAADNYIESAYYADNPLFKLMNPSLYAEFENIAIGSSYDRDTAKINNLFRNPAIKKYLPSDIRFVWESNGSWYNSLISLYAVKNQFVNTEYMTNYMIESSKVKKAQIYGIKSNIQFKEQYHALWKKLTKDNIDKQLLIIVDNEVIMYPYVSSEIENGNVSISSGTDNNQNRVLSAILNSDLLNADIEILEVNWDYPPMHYLMKLFN